MKKAILIPSAIILVIILANCQSLCDSLLGNNFTTDQKQRICAITSDAVRNRCIEYCSSKSPDYIDECISACTLLSAAEAESYKTASELPEFYEDERYIDYIYTINDFTGDPPALPTSRRVIGIDTFIWKGKSYLMINKGNGIILYNIENPESPILISENLLCCNGTNCPTHPPGDHDYNLYRASPCDDCRYVAASLAHAGSILVDLGTGSAPVMTSCVPVESYEHSRGNLRYFDGYERTMWQIKPLDRTWEYDNYYCDLNAISEIRGVSSPQYGYRLDSGEILIVDNNSFLHTIDNYNRINTTPAMGFAVYGNEIIYSSHGITRFAYLQNGIPQTPYDVFSYDASIFGMNGIFFVGARKAERNAFHGFRRDSKTFISGSDFWHNTKYEWNDVKSINFGFAFHPTNNDYFYAARYVYSQIFKFRDPNLIFKDGFQTGNTDRWSDEIKQW